MKNLYLPGTNKNVGYLDQYNRMYIYKRFKKYLNFPLFKDGITIWSKMSDGPIFLQKDDNIEKHIQMQSYDGYWYNVDTKTQVFGNCKFKIPDNLDVIEMAYLYKHWKANESRSRTDK